MYILIEEEYYELTLLERLFDDPKFYKVKGEHAKITSVGYYHSFDKDQLVFMLPKVFVRDHENTVLGVNKDELIKLASGTSIKHKNNFLWLRQLSIYFYNSLLEYRKRHYDSILLEESTTFELNTNLNEKEYSFLDILLSLINFYKKNKQQILFKHIEFSSNHMKKVKWETTIRKSLPIISNGNVPIYPELIAKKKITNKEEELLTYFFSIISHLNKTHSLNLTFDHPYAIIKGKAFQILCKNGLKKLQKIKFRYFSDVFVRMYKLCELYFSQFDQSNIRKKREDFLSISNYNIVFEDMIDKLFSEDFKDLEVNDISIEDLKHNQDGKIIDHLYSHQSLIDNSDIFYIGDSKYYKSNSEAGKVSKYKQFTYAKNIIQFNIDLLNFGTPSPKYKMRYWDKVTEGYNITPNFFVYGYIDDPQNYQDHCISKKGKPIESFHFEHRLFDRDTLFVQQYQINFLYVLKAYTTFNLPHVQKFRSEVKLAFRNNFIDFFNSDKCKFQFYSFKESEEKIEEFIVNNFRVLNGKCFKTIDNKLILAKHSDDTSLNELLCHFESIPALD